MAQVNIKQLEAFVLVAELGGFRRAAEKLNTTQPNISTRVSALEEQLGVKLMERDAGSVRLTTAGNALLPKARQVINSVDEFLVAAEDDRLFEGVLRLGVTEMVVHSWLAQYLSAFRSQFPGIEVALTVDLSTHLSTVLFNRSIDLALQSGPFNHQTSGSVPLGNFPYLWVAAPELGFDQQVLTLEELSVHPILTHAQGTLPFEQLRSHLAASGNMHARLSPSTNMSACIQLTIEGLGIACLPEVMVRKQIKSGELMQLRYLWTPEDLSFHARYDVDTSPYFVAEAARIAGEISMEDLNKR